MNVGNMIAGATNQANNSTLEKYCYGNSYGNCQTQGGLYQWNEAMQYSASEGAQGICPTGWHVPTDAQQNTLDQYLSNTTCNASRNGAWDCADAGTKLKSGGSSGFEGLLGGIRTTDGTSYGQGTYALFWSSSINGSNAWVRYLISSDATVYRLSALRAASYSVRCLKD